MNDLDCPTDESKEKHFYSYLGQVLQEVTDIFWSFSETLDHRAVSKRGESAELRQVMSMEQQLAQQVLLVLVVHVVDLVGRLADGVVVGVNIQP